MLVRLIFTFTTLFSFEAYSKVRSVESDDNKMIPITLSLGRSTVLQFLDTPKKVISGNSNYFNIEFSGTDVTIQPLSQVNSNLFIYSGHRRYGFHIRTCLCSTYDDLVKVYWKQPQKAYRPLHEQGQNLFKAKSFEVSKATVYVNKVFFHKFNEVYVVSGSIAQPKSYSKPKPESFKITGGGKTHQILDVVYNKTHSFEKLNHYRFRVFFKLDTPQDLALRAKFNGQENYTLISRKDLL